MAEAQSIRPPPRYLGSYEVSGRLSPHSVSAHLARDVRSGERLVIKMLAPAAAGADLYWIKQEFRALRDLRSPHVVPVYDLVTGPDVTYVAMPLVEGMSLDAWCAGGLVRRAPVAVLRVLRDVASGLSDLHAAGLVHRDIKPANVIVTPQGRAVLVDLGFAVRLPGARSAHEAIEDDPSGTLVYMPPEALLAAAASPAWDTFSFGVTAFEVVTGSLPPRNDCTWEVLDTEVPALLAAAWPTVPEPLAALVGRAMATDPSCRGCAARLHGVLSELAGDGDGDGMPGTGAWETPLIGRDQELAQLHRLLSGRAARVAVTGPTGIGKTALIETTLRASAGRPQRPLVFAGRCHPGEQLPYRGLDEVVDALFRYLLREGSHMRHPLTSEAVATLSAAFPVLQQLRAANSRPQQALPDPQTHRMRLGPALAQLLRRVGESRHTIVWIDDVHWIDDDGVRLLGDLVAALGGQSEPGSSVLLSGWRLTGTLQTDFAVLVPQPLAANDAYRLLADRMRCQGPPVRDLPTARWVVDAALGNPAFLHHLADGLSSVGEPCGSLREIIDRRLGALSTTARAIMEGLCLFGHPLPVDALLRLSGVPDYRRELRALEVVGLARTVPAFATSCFDLSHDSLREAILCAIPAARAAALHRRLARAVEGFPNMPPQVAAHHYQLGGELTQALDRFEAGGHDALRALAFEEAVNCFERALGLVETGDDRPALRRSLAESLSLAGRAEQAAVEFVACAQVSTSRQRDALLSRAATAYLLAGKIEQGLSFLPKLLRPLMPPLSLRPAFSLIHLLYQRCLGSLTAPKPAARESARAKRCGAAADTAYAAVTILSGVDVILAAHLQVLHIRHARASGDPLRIGRALAVEAGLRAARGQPASKVAPYLRQARGMAGAFSDPRTEALFALVEMSSTWASGRWPQCVEAGQRAERIAEDRCAGAWWELGFSRAVMQDALRWSGRYAELRQVTERYLRDAQARRDRYAIVTFRVRFEATLKLIDDDPRVAWEACGAASDWVSSGVQLQHLAEFHARTECLLYMGRNGAALAYARRRVRALRWSPLLLAVPPRAKCTHQLAACKLAYARSVGGDRRARLIRSARKDARRVRDAGWAYTSLLAAILEFTCNVLERKAAEPDLSRLRKQAEATDMPQFAAALACAAAPSPAGRAAGERELLDLGVKAPLRWAQVLVPGLAPPR